MQPAALHHVSPVGQVFMAAVKEGVQCPFHYPNSMVGLCTLESS
jgi:hypothetical protein